MKIKQKEPELFVLKYGESKYAAKYVFHQDKSGKMVEFSWLFYLIKYDGRVILVDCGFETEKYLQAFRINEYIHPVELLKSINITPDEVTDLIITHAHFDHIGNISHFKNARIIIQEDEYKSYLKSYSAEKYQPEEKRLNIFKEEYNLYEKILIKKVGGHSAGSSVVRFTIDGKRIVLTGDECYLKRNYLEKIAVGTVYSPKKNMEFILSLNPEKESIFTFHDPETIKSESRVKKLF